MYTDCIDIEHICRKKWDLGMFDVLNDIKGHIKLDDICIDNNVFRLHYKVLDQWHQLLVGTDLSCVQATFVILLTASALVTAKTYIGDPIDCIVEEIPQGVMDTYCWIHSTFRWVTWVSFDDLMLYILPSVTNEDGSPEAHPGVKDVHPENDEVRFHKYYQWVCFTLFFQALCFYIPR